MKLVTKPIPRKCSMYKFISLAQKMEVGQCCEGCTEDEAKNMHRALKRLGFRSVRRKLNGSGINVWKLAPEKP